MPTRTIQTDRTSPRFAASRTRHPSTSGFIHIEHCQGHSALLPGEIKEIPLIGDI